MTIGGTNDGEGVRARGRHLNAIGITAEALKQEISSMRVSNVGQALHTPEDGVAEPIGAEVERKPFSSGSDIDTAFAAGAVDIGLGGPPGFVSGRRRASPTGLRAPRLTRHHVGADGSGRVRNLRLRRVERQAGRRATRIGGR